VASSFLIRSGQLCSQHSRSTRCISARRASAATAAAATFAAFLRRGGGSGAATATATATATAAVAVVALATTASSGDDRLYFFRSVGFSS
jgi:hypothetical protein